jgi:hypothetical protein
MPPVPVKEAPMAPKIDPIQHLPGTDPHMSITGPIGDWEPDVAGVVFTVVVSQVTGDTNEDPKVATAIGWSQQYTPNAVPVVLKWSATIRAVSPDALQIGDATVAAWATYALKDGGAESYEWTLPVKIVAA